MERINFLKTFTQDEPENPFNWYAYAIEVKKTNTEEASLIFDKLLSEFPAYLPTYYQAAHFFIEQNQFAKAKNCFEKGIDLAAVNKENKTLKELKSSLEAFLFEFEEEL